MLFHDIKTNSAPVYNELYGNIELDSVHADLFNDYLNYFLPVNERDVNFPSFVADSSNQIMPSHSTTSNQVILPTHRHQHTNLFKRKIQKLLINPANVAASGASSSSGNASGDDLASMLGETDRLGDMKKIDLFLRLINEFLVYPFTDMSTGPAAQRTQSLKFTEGLTSNLARSPSPNHMATSSPLKYNDPTHYLANIEIIFALSMVLKHSHLFCNAFTARSSTSSGILDSKGDHLNEQQLNTFYRNKSYIPLNSQYECPTDEFRSILFKSYWRKPFYKFLQFHFVHWSLTPSIKWLIELWFSYIQPWKFRTDPTNLIVEKQSLTEFLKENYLIYADIYQLIVKRFCIVDFTIEDNLLIINQILDVIFYLNKKWPLFLYINSYFIF